MRLVLDEQKLIVLYKIFQDILTQDRKLVDSDIL